MRGAKGNPIESERSTSQEELERTECSQMLGEIVLAAFKSWIGEAALEQQLQKLQHKCAPTTAGEACALDSLREPSARNQWTSM